MQQNQIDQLKNSCLREIARQNLAIYIMSVLGDKLSESCYISPSYIVEVSVYNRDDLTHMMTLAPMWKKEYENTYIRYNAEINGCDLVLKAYDAALPATCTEVEEDLTIPEVIAQPSRIIKVKKIKCNL